MLLHIENFFGAKFLDIQKTRKSKKILGENFGFFKNI